MAESTAAVEAAVGMVCPLCGGTGAPWGERNGVLLRTCCGTLLCWDWPCVAAYEALYEGLEYHHDVVVAQGQRPQWQRFEEHRRAARCRLDWLQDQGFHPGTSLKWLLDVGASNGALVVEAQSRGVRYVCGIEPSSAMCDHVLEQHGIVLQNTSWQGMYGQYDLIMATDVIEHLTEPEEFLRRALRHSVALYLETPDWHEDVPADWKHIRVKEHICLYSEPALMRLAARAGWSSMVSLRPIAGKLGLLVIA